MHVSRIALPLALLAISLPAVAQKAPAYPSETPDHFQPSTAGFEYQRRDVMIPMRDGVKLHTVILVPNGAKGASILLTRTPYDATALTSHEQSSHLGPILQGYDNAVDPGGTGYPREIRLGGRLHYESPDPWTAESNVH
jgi:uncharacterized protein